MSGIIKQTAKKRGFTIVELLIVIVVIAILATISIVAFNGIQTRANNTKTIAATQEYVKAYSYHLTDKGDYPKVGGCLGEVDSSTNRCLSQNSVAACFSMGGAAAGALNDSLKPYMNNQTPSTGGQKIPCGGTTYEGSYAYFSSSTNSPVLYMLLRGDQECPSMSPNVASKSKAYATDMTRCAYVLEGVS